jgi:hypothetical protein
MKGSVEAKDVVHYLVQAYTSVRLVDGEMKRLMLTAALWMRAGAVTDEVIEALECEALKLDWRRGK